MILKKFIVFLVRKRLGLKKYQHFRFSNQKHELDFYYFTETDITKFRDIDGVRYPSSISLNYLLSDVCKNDITLVEDN